MAKKLLVCILLTLVATSTTFAQGQALPPLEIITADNIDRIEELAQWEVFSAAAFSPDGQYLAIALHDGFIHFLSLPSLEIERSLSGADFGASELRFSRDGSRLLLFGGPLALWEVNSGQQIYRHEFDEDDLYFELDAGFHNLVRVTRGDHLVAVINTDTGNELFTIQPAEVRPFPQLDATGSLLLIVGEGGGFTVWDIPTQSIKYQFEPPAQYELEGFGFNPDGSLIWANWRDFRIGRGSNENHSIIRFWNTSDGSESFALDGDGGHHSMGFSPMGTIMVTTGEGDNLQSALWIWNTNDKRLLKTTETTGGAVIGFSPDDKLLAIGCGTCGFLEIWDLEATDQPNRIWTIETNGYVSPSFSPDGQLLLTVGEVIQLWGVPEN